MQLPLIEEDPAPQRRLERRGIGVALCKAGLMALLRWKQRQPDVVVLYLSLPAQDGLAPIGLIMLIDTATLCRQAPTAVNTAYGRALFASDKSIGESLEVEGGGEQARFRASVPNSALEAFEADNCSHGEIGQGRKTEPDSR